MVHIHPYRDAYDAFLKRYPYCYGYWKKYADTERKHENMAMTEKVSWSQHAGSYHAVEFSRNRISFPSRRNIASSPCEHQPLWWLVSILTGHDGDDDGKRLCARPQLHLWAMVVGYLKYGFLWFLNWSRNVDHPRKSAYHITFSSTDDVCRHLTITLP